jgi:hypothetical protein
MATDRRTYVKIADSMPDHPKVVRLSDSAFRLWVEAICYCSRHLTDGVISPAALRKVGPPKAARELAEAGLLEVHGPDWLVHDYLQHQRSAAEVAAAVEQRREAGQRGGLAKQKRLASPPLSELSSDSLSEPGSKRLAETELETEEQLLGATSASQANGRRRTRAPDLLPVTPEMRQWAAANNVTVDLPAATAQMLDHHRGKGSLMADWTSAWRTWMTNTKRFGGPEPEVSPRDEWRRS